MEHFFEALCNPECAFIALLLMGGCVVYLMKSFFVDGDE